jgi:hypothetical protein
METFIHWSFHLPFTLPGEILIFWLTSLQMAICVMGLIGWKLVVGLGRCLCLLPAKGAV